MNVLGVVTSCCLTCTSPANHLSTELCPVQYFTARFYGADNMRHWRLIMRLQMLGFYEALPMAQLQYKLRYALRGALRFGSICYSAELWEAPEQHLTVRHRVACTSS